MLFFIVSKKWDFECAVFLVNVLFLVGSRNHISPIIYRQVGRSGEWYLLVWYWLFNSNIYSMVYMGDYIYSREVGKLLKFQGIGDGESRCIQVWDWWEMGVWLVDNRIFLIVLLVCNGYRKFQKNPLLKIWQIPLYLHEMTLFLT